MSSQGGTAKVEELLIKFRICTDPDLPRNKKADQLAFKEMIELLKPRVRLHRKL